MHELRYIGGRLPIGHGIPVADGAKDRRGAQVLLDVSYCQRCPSSLSDSEPSESGGERARLQCGSPVPMIDRAKQGSPADSAPGAARRHQATGAPRKNSTPIPFFMRP